MNKPTTLTPDDELRNQILAVISGADEVARITNGLADEKYIARQEALLTGFTHLLAARNRLLAQQMRELKVYEFPNPQNEDEMTGFNHAIDVCAALLTNASKPELPKKVPGANIYFIADSSNTEDKS